MISLEEVRRLAQHWQIAPEVVEKDYCLGWMLYGLVHSPLHQVLVLKGGTALRKGYFPEYRFSEDLDYTLTGPVEEAFLREGLARAALLGTRASGVQFELVVLEQVRLEAETPAWQARLSFVGPRAQARDPRRIRLDLTAFEQLLWPPASRPLLHPYPDTCSAPLAIYPLEEIFAEKLRTLLQRGYPRDVDDVWYLLQHLPSPVDAATLRARFGRKCAYKDVRYTGVEQIEGIWAAKQTALHWDQSLGLQIRDLPVWERVRQELVQGLGALWG